MTLTYASYLKIEELLALQRPLSEGPEHDETLFIVVHQAYELWFKQVLHELDYLVALLQDDEVTRAQRTLRRVLTIWKLLVQQLDILETMGPLDFHSFRDRLETASGFQSAQFRELEFLLGHKREGLLELFPRQGAQRKRLEQRLARPTLWDAALQLLHRRGHAMPLDQLARDVRRPVEPSDAVQAALLGVYHDGSDLASLCELLLDLDEGIQEWRYRHVKMVERTLGDRRGTGGSAGVSYLRGTLFKPFFPDLWAIRSALGES